MIKFKEFLKEGKEDRKAELEEEILNEMPESSWKTRDVHHHLKKKGWELTRTSGSHDVYTHPKSTERIAVPRHKQLKAPLIRGILKIAATVSEEADPIKRNWYVMTSNMNTRKWEVVGTHDSHDKAQKHVKQLGKSGIHAKIEKGTRLSEETEQIDEVSKLTLKSYIGKSIKDECPEKQEKREAGRTTAIRKLIRKNGPLWTIKKEEVEIEEGRLAMPLKGHDYHYKSDAELRYIAKDAHEAAKNMQAMGNREKEGKYLDQVNDAHTVLGYRQRGGKQLERKKELSEMKSFKSFIKEDVEQLVTEEWNAPHYNVTRELSAKASKEGHTKLTGHYYPNGHMGKRIKQYEVEVPHHEYERVSKTLKKIHGNSVKAAEALYHHFKPKPELSEMKSFKSFIKEDVEQLDEMKLGKKDHEVIKAFMNKKSASSKKLSTDGKHLDGNWLGGSKIAHHGEKGIHLNDVGSRAGQTIHRAIKKHNSYDSHSNVPHYELHEETLNEGENVFDKHKTNIAKKTLRMHDAVVGVMGGMNKEEARAHLKKMGWSDEQIKKHEHGK